MFRTLLTVAALLLIACTSALVTMHFAIHGTEVRLPDLKGMTIAAAKQKIGLAGLNLRVEEKLYSTTMGEGRVLLQSPEPGTAVRRDWTVRVGESLGPERVRIPNVLGEEERAASIAVRRVQLTLGGVARMPDALAEPGAVLAEDPPPDAAGVEQPAVSLLVAASDARPGAGWVTPNWVGMQVSQVQAVLARAGLPAAVVSLVDGATGVVMRQSPAAGERLAADSVVQLDAGR